MKVDVFTRELVLPLYLALPLLSIAVMMYSIALYTTVYESRQDKLCEAVKESAREATPLAPTPEEMDQHFGCSADPVYPRRHACPSCFHPTILNHFRDELFPPVPDEMYLFPRRPAGFFQPRPVRQQNLVKSVLLAPQAVCVDVCPFLVALVESVTHDWRTRLEIRRTWASVAKTNHWPGQGNLNTRLSVIFVVACDSGYSEQCAASEWRHLQEEAELFRDLLVLDMVDSSRNLTLKIISGLYWASRHCSRSKFFLKIDQETFLNVPVLLDLLAYHEKRLQRSVTGHIYTQGRKVQNTGPSDGSLRDFNMDQFPVFAAGFAYILSREAVGRVVALFPFYPAIGREDAFITGVLGRGAGLQHFSPPHNMFFAEFSSRISGWCRLLQDGLVTITGIGSWTQRANLWASIISSDSLCKKKDTDDVSDSC